MKIIIEGIDRLGKDTLIDGLINSLGYHHCIHYSYPKNTKYYVESLKDRDEDTKDSTFWYQHDSFMQGFKLLEQDTNVIFNRFHLGEYVYSSRYRNYDGSYVFGLEKMFSKSLAKTFLFLLYTPNVHILKDDGKSHDYSKREEEQNDFLKGFDLSAIINKHKINVYDSFGDHYKPKSVILNEVLAKIKHC